MHRKTILVTAILLSQLTLAHSALMPNAINNTIPSVASLTIHTPDHYGQSERIGTGFVYNDNGHMITNAHVVGGYSKVIATFQDNKNCFATLVGQDEESDIAVLKLEPHCKAKPIKIGTDLDLKVGEQVVAIGNPFGLNQTVTQGIISALHRDGVMPGKTTDFIQIDAAINFGNSGGPLINTEGELVGINSAFVSGSGNQDTPANSGLGLAIPITTAKPIIKQIIDTGNVTRGYIGVIVQEMSDSLKHYLNHQGGFGLFITQVVKNSPAEKAGLKEGDIISHVNQVRLATVNQFPLLITSHPPNSKILISGFRGKEKLKLTVRSTSSGALNQLVDTAENDHKYLFSGVTLLKVDARNGRNHPLNGLEIINIDTGSQAFLEGLRQGDIITHINDKPMKAFENIPKINKNNNQYVKITINRGGQLRILAMRVNNEA